MVAEQLKSIFDKYIDLDIEVWENFQKLGDVEDFPREFVLKESNTIESHLNILLEGCGGHLIWGKNNFVCIDIASANDFLCDYMSFTLQSPTPIEVRLFEDSKVFRLPYPHFQQTLNAGNHGGEITRLIAEKSFIEKQQQQIDLLTMTAKERYIDMINTNNETSQVALKYIASYLGITPQSLSRIRAGKM